METRLVSRECITLSFSSSIDGGNIGTFTNIIKES